MQERHRQFTVPVQSRLLLFIVSAQIALATVSVGASTSIAAPQLFGSDGSSRMYNINRSTGTATFIGVGSFLSSLDRRPNGVLYGAGSTLQTINTSTGQATLVGPLPEFMSGIAFSPSDQLFGVSNIGDTLYRLDPATGSALSSVTITGTIGSGGAPFPGEINGIDFAPDGTLYGVGLGLYTINPLTGVATRITPAGFNVAGFLDTFGDIDYGPDGVLHGLVYSFVSFNAPLYTINPSTGLGTLVGATGFDMRGLASVPEPGTLVLFAIGGVGLLVWRRRISARRA